MAHPTKRHGFRRIVCQERAYLWRFVAEAEQGTLTVVPDGRSGQRMLVALPDHRDPWLHPGEISQQPAPITPSFVAQVISLGLDAGWSPDTPGGTFQLTLS